MKKTLVLAVTILAVCCLSFLKPKPAHAAGGTDSWLNAPANCQGFNNTGVHICEFVITNVMIERDPTRFNYWNHVAVEPGVVTDVTCTTHGTHIFRLLGAGPKPNKDNPWKGAHYGNVAICNGWINGGNGPVDMTVTYQ